MKINSTLDSILNGNQLSVETLNARRRDAVRLRLQGLKLALVAEMTGLSTPTVIAAVKAYRKGGWPAVEVAHRQGRPRLHSASTEPSDAHALYKAMTEGAPNYHGLPYMFWSRSAVSGWLERYGTGKKSVGAAKRLCRELGLTPELSAQELAEVTKNHGDDPRRRQNVHLQHVDVTKEARNQINNQKACIVWFTGLSGAGKSTIANLVEKKLHALGHRTYLLDGDNVRHGLNKDLGFTDVDRVENIRRVAEVAKLMVDAGLIVLTAFISPFQAERSMARSLVNKDEFFEIHADVPLATVEQRDVKGLYKKARRGELKNFTGIDSRYEAPESPELRLETANLEAEEAAEQVIKLLSKHGRLI